MKKLVLLLLAGTIAIPTISEAQTSKHASDVVVMRRTVATPTRKPGAGTWTYGDWGYTTQDACTTSAPQTRQVTCTVDGDVVATSRCETTPDPDSRTIARTDGCASVAWVATPASGFNPSCTPATTVSQTSACIARKADGTTSTFPDELCTGPRPASQITTGISTTGCASIDWTTGVRGAWAPSECSASATYPVTSNCRAHVASNDVGFVVEDTRCDASKKPQSPAAAVITSGCSKIDWTTTPTGTYTSTCSATATRPQTVACTATAPDGSTFTLPDARCTGTKPSTTTAPAPVYSGCTAKWSTTPFVNDSGHGECSASVPQSRTAICVATVGGVSTTIPDSNCVAAGAGAGTKATILTQTTSDYSSCTGTWVAGSTYTYGTCSNFIRSKNRDDVCKNTTTGQVYADGSQCNPNSHPIGWNATVGCLGTCAAFAANTGIGSASNIGDGQAGYVGTLTGTAAQAYAKNYCEEVLANGNYKYLVACILQGSFVYPQLSNSKSVTFANSATKVTSNGSYLAVCTAN